VRAVFATLRWSSGSTRARLLEPLGNLPPDEYEAQYYAQMEAESTSHPDSRRGARRILIPTTPLTGRPTSARYDVLRPHNRGTTHTEPTANSHERLSDKPGMVHSPHGA
jgi:hypothetical protein